MRRGLPDRETGAWSVAEAMMRKLPVILSAMPGRYRRSATNTEWVKGKAGGIVLRNFREIVRR